MQQLSHELHNSKPLACVCFVTLLKTPAHSAQAVILESSRTLSVSLPTEIMVELVWNFWKTLKFKQDFQYSEIWKNYQTCMVCGVLQQNCKLVFLPIRDFLFTFSLNYYTSVILKTHCNVNINAVSWQTCAS